MPPLSALAAEAVELGQGGAVLTPVEAEVSRQMSICNACRYCEGFCAVFPAMARRLEFGKAEVNYLANLCHNCGACYHACQYAPPHDFAVNVPRAMAQVRAETYTAYAWPRTFAALYRHNGLTVAAAVALGMAGFLALDLALTGSLLDEPGPGDFYATFPHGLMTGLFGAAFAFAVLALGLGVARFWRDIDAGAPGAAAAAEAGGNVLALTYLGGGHGQGCNEAGDGFTLARRRFHHLTFYGFAACFAATCAATLMHYGMGLEAPYPLLSIPVALGTVGGMGLLIGPAGLLWLNLRRDPMAGDPAQRPMDRGFIALLLGVSASGLVLLAARTSTAMPLLLALHLGVVMALLLTLPYGKFAHGIFRSAALLKWTAEKRRPSRLALE